MGPSLNLLSVPNVVAGATYQVTAYVLLAAPDSSNPTVTISIKTADCATSGALQQSCHLGGVVEHGMDESPGHFSFSNLWPPTNLILYIQSSSATDSFYIGDVIGELAPAPLARASRTTRVSPPPSRMAAWMAGVPALAVPR